MYLLDTLREVQSAHNGQLPESHPLLYSMDAYPEGAYGLAPEQKYIWFTMPHDKGKHSFAGFFFIIGEDREIVNFGWHKP